MADEQTPWTLQSMARSLYDWFTDPTNLQWKDLYPAQPGQPSPVSNVPELPPPPEAFGGPKPGPTIGPFRGRLLDQRDIAGAALQPFDPMRGHRSVTEYDPEFARFGGPTNVPQLAYGIYDSPLGMVLDPELAAGKLGMAAATKWGPIPGLYSQVDRIVEKALREKPVGRPTQIWDALRKANPEELKYRGLEPGPKGPKGPTAPAFFANRNPNQPMGWDEVAKALEGKPAPWPSILELTERDAPRTGVSSSYPSVPYRFLLGPGSGPPETYFTGYVTPGGRDYRENLFRFPSHPDRFRLEEELERLRREHSDLLLPSLRQTGAPEDAATEWIRRMFETTGMHPNADQVRAAMAALGPPYVGPHYAIPDIMGWSRTNEYFHPDFGWGMVGQEYQSDPIQKIMAALRENPPREIWRRSPSEIQPELEDIQQRLPGLANARLAADTAWDQSRTDAETMLEALTRESVPEEHRHYANRWDIDYYDDRAAYDAWQAARDAAENNPRYLEALENITEMERRYHAANAARNAASTRRNQLQALLNPSPDVPPRYPFLEDWHRTFLARDIQEALRRPPVERRPGEGPSTLKWFGLLQGDTMNTRGAAMANVPWYERDLPRTINTLMGEGLQGTRPDVKMTTQGLTLPSAASTSYGTTVEPRLSVVNLDPEGDDKVIQKLLETGFKLMGLGGVGALGASQLLRPPEEEQDQRGQPPPALRRLMSSH